MIRGHPWGPFPEAAAGFTSMLDKLFLPEAACLCSVGTSVKKGESQGLLACPFHSIPKPLPWSDSQLVPVPLLG